MGGAGSTALGTVRLTRNVMADGKPLAAGTYTVQLTADEAKPPAAGQTASLERWVEFVQSGQVKGREVVTIVPDSDIAQVANGPRPKAGAARVEMLKGNDYLRVWINRDGNNYLIHLPPQRRSSAVQGSRVRRFRVRRFVHVRRFGAFEPTFEPWTDSRTLEPNLGTTEP